MDIRRSIKGWSQGRVPPLAIAILLLTAVVRFYHLAAQPLWYDELISMSMGLFQGGLKAIWTVKDYPHPLLYPSMLYLLFRAFPANEFTVRLVSVFGGLLAFPFFYRFVTDQANKRLALVGMLLLALSPFHIFFSQEGRPYALMFTLVLVTVWVLHKALETNRAGWWVLHFFCLLTLLYLHYFNWSIVGSEMLYVLIYWRRYKRSLGPFALSLLAAPLSIPGLIPLIRDSLSAGQVLVLDLVPVSISFPVTWKTLIAGEARYVTENIRTFGAIAFGLLAIAGGARLWHTSRRLLVLILCMLAVPLIFVFVVLRIMGYVVPPYEEKMFIIALPFALMLAASGIEGLWSLRGSRAIRTAGVVVAVVCLVVLLGGNLLALQSYYTSFEKNLDVRVIDYLETQVGADDLVISDGFSMALNLKYHWDADQTPDMVAWASNDSGQWQFSPDLSALPETPIQRTVTMEDVLSYPRVWLVAQGGFGRPQLATDLQGLVSTDSEERFGPFAVYLFVP